MARRLEKSKGTRAHAGGDTDHFSTVLVHTNGVFLHPFNIQECLR